MCLSRFKLLIFSRAQTFNQGILRGGGVSIMNSYVTYCDDGRHGAKSLGSFKLFLNTCHGHYENHLSASMLIIIFILSYASLILCSPTDWRFNSDLVYVTYNVHRRKCNWNGTTERFNLEPPKLWRDTERYAVNALNAESRVLASESSSSPARSDFKFE